MGTQQFYSPLKSSIDTIEQLVNTVSADVDQVNLLVTEMKNTDMGDLNTKIDNLDMPSNYTTFKTTDTQLWSSPIVVPLNITGAGWLVGLVNQGSAGQAVAITVDGVKLTGVSNPNPAYAYRTVYTQGYSYTRLSIRFDTSLKIEMSDASYAVFHYVLD